MIQVAEPTAPLGFCIPRALLVPKISHRQPPIADLEDPFAMNR